MGDEIMANREKGKEIMKKFMKFCFVLAMVLIIIGGALYLVGRKDGGRGNMEELLSEFGGEWVNFDLETDFGFTGYDLDESSIFDSVHTTWKGDVDKQIIYQGSIDKLYLESGGSMVEFKDSDDGNIYIEGKSVGKLQAYVEGGVLYIKSVRPANLMDEIKNSTITLYLPNENRALQQLEVSLGAGQLQLNHLAVQNMMVSIGAGQLLLTDMALGTVEVSLGAGELRAEDVTVENLTASVGAGNMELSGAIYTDAKISCSMGNVHMELEGEQKDFNYDLSCVAGNMEIGEDSFSGAVMDRSIDNSAAKSMDIDCSMGNVEVIFR